MANEKRMVEERIIPRCKDCGYRVRGKNHTEGTHHKSPKKR